MTLSKYLFSILILSFTSCIGDDFVDDFVEPEIRVASIPQSIAAGETFQLEAQFLNDVGQSADVEFVFTTENSTIATVDGNGLIAALNEGSTQLTISTTYKDIQYDESLQLNIAEETVIIEDEPKSGIIRTTSSYELKGAFTLSNSENGVKLDIAADYVASEALPGLYVYLTNNPNTNVGALEIGMVTVYQGAHSYEIANVTLDDYSHILYYCKPFSVKVGDGEIID